LDVAASVVDSGHITAEMMNGLTLRRKEAKEVVSNAIFSTFEGHVLAGDFEEAKKLLDTSTQFGRLLTRTLLGFKSESKL